MSIPDQIYLVCFAYDRYRVLFAEGIGEVCLLLSQGGVFVILNSWHIYLPSPLLLYFLSFICFPPNTKKTF